MVDKSADGSDKARKSKKECVWTETDLKYLVLVLGDEKKQYAVRLETLALKKSANNQVFEEISGLAQGVAYQRDILTTYLC